MVFNFRLSIRRFVEKAHSEGVDDSCAEFKNLATILEHILSHRLKGKTKVLSDTFAVR